MIHDKRLRKIFLDLKNLYICGRYYSISPEVLVLKFICDVLLIHKKIICCTCKIICTQKPLHSGKQLHFRRKFIPRKIYIPVYKVLHNCLKTNLLWGECALNCGQYRYWNSEGGCSVITLISWF